MMLVPDRRPSLTDVLSRGPAPSADRAEDPRKRVVPPLTQRIESSLAKGVPRRTGEQEEQMGLDERLLEERAEGERRRGGPLPPTRGSGSKVLAKRLQVAPKDRPPGYAADLATMHRLITEGPRSPGMGMRLGSLRNRYPEEHAELKAEAWRQGELL